MNIFSHDPWFNSLHTMHNIDLFSRHIYMSVRCFALEIRNSSKTILMLMKSSISHGDC